MNHSLQSQQRRWRKLTKRECAWLTGLATFAFAALFAWRPLRHELTLSLVLHSDGPSDSALSELANDGSDRVQVLERMWQSGNLTAREFVLDYLNTRLHREPALFNRVDAIVTEAAHDPDLKVREPALNILAGHKSLESLALIRTQLNDPDPAVRVLALQQLQRIANSNDAPSAIRLLNDPDPRVVVQAASLLRKVTGFDSGIRIGDAPPNFTLSDVGVPQASPDLEAIQYGVRRWREWWSSNQTEFSESPALPQVAASVLPVKDFTLEDLDGRSVRLSDFRGKVVLLCFWKTGDARSFNDLAALKQLQEQERQRLAVVGVAFDPAVGLQDECEEEGHEHGQMMMNGHLMTMNASPGPVESVVRDAVRQMHIPFPVLLDKKGTAVFRFNVQEIPTYALIDADGNLRRRFAGSRTVEVFKAMADEETNPTAALTKLDR